ncbi:MAG: glycosyltransferase family 4 protein, partial [Anaerolineae bacterium]|nr:glycosyltransferase family 4 protein [Anaerolineae bacterium]
MPWRVLYVDHADLMGGAEQSLLLLLRHLDRDQVEPLLACGEDTPLARAAREAGVPVAEVPMGQLRDRRVPWAPAVRLAQGGKILARLARAFGADLLHANVARAAAYAAWASVRAGVPLVWHVRDVHDTRRPDEWLLVQALSRVAEGIVCISRATARPLPAVARPKVRVVPNGLDPAQFDLARAEPQALRARWGAAPEEVWVGAVGWLAPWKQVEHVVEMAQRVAQECPEARFVVVGEAAAPRYAPYVASLKTRAREALGERMRFVGALPAEAMPSVMAALDLLVHTARAEPFGRVLVEAMAMERPVVAYADGGVPEVVSDGETGCLVPPGDVDALAR